MKRLELSHVTYHYPGGQTALSDISCVFETGKCYCIEGPNGCGKTTLFRILSGLAFPDAGTYTADGRPITQAAMRNRKTAAWLHRSIGVVMQNTEVQLFTSSVEEEVAFGLQQMDLPEAEVRERTEKYLSLLELSALRTRAPWALSGGEKKRCALSAVLAMEPSVYILDEPISGLDEEGQEWITRFLLSLKSPEHTLIIASHSRDFAERIADIRIRMDRNHQIPAL